MTAQHRHKLLGGPVRDRGPGTSCAGFGATVHLRTYCRAYRACAPPRPPPCGKYTTPSCGAVRADIADTGG